MHDIWNPWHGCRKCSEGCLNCYMFFLDRMRNQNGADIYCTGAGFRYPLSKDRNGRFKVQSGEMLRVCMTSDFFLEEADQWRPEAWKIIRQRPDVKFYLLTKRPQRVADCLPPDWGDGWENVFFNVSCENQKRTDERIPFLLDLPRRLYFRSAAQRLSSARERAAAEFRAAAIRRLYRPRSMPRHVPSCVLSATWRSGSRLATSAGLPS